MKYGIHVPNFGPYGDARLLADLARASEQAGWDGFFLWDQITRKTSYPTPVVDVQVALTAIALSTERIRFGALITPLARRRPVKYAREALTLDRLSNGRLIAGIGLGGGTEELDDLGEEPDPKVRAAMIDEGLAVITGLWTGKPFSFKGEHYWVEDVTYLPTPVQQPHIPIWLAGTLPLKAPFRRAALWDGVFPLMQNVPYDQMMPADQFPPLLDLIRSERHSDAPFDVAHWGISPGDSAKAAEIVQTYANVGVTWWLENISPWRFGGISADGSWNVAAMRERIVQGPPKL